MVSDDLIRYLLATSEDRARTVGELTARNPDMADLLIDLEADDGLRAVRVGVVWGLDVGLLVEPDWGPDTGT